MRSTASSFKKTKFLGMFSGLLLLLYPLMIYFGLQYIGITLLVPLIIVLLTIRLCLLNIKVVYLLWILRVGIVLGIILAILSWLLSTSHLLLYYPVCSSLLMLSVFAYSLYHPPSVVEQLARLTEPDLPSQGIIYTKRVTQIWCVFFIVNAIVAMVTCVINDMAYWTLYNGLISYILMGMLMGGEWLVRQRVRKDYV